MPQMGGLSSPGGVLARRFLQKFHKYDWQEKFKNQTSNIKIKMSAQNTKLENTYIFILNYIFAFLFYCCPVILHFYFCKLKGFVLRREGIPSFTVRNCQEIPLHPTEQPLKKA